MAVTAVRIAAIETKVIVTTENDVAQAVWKIPNEEDDRAVWKNLNDVDAQEVSKNPEDELARAVNDASRIETPFPNAPVDSTAAMPISCSAILRTEIPEPNEAPRVAAPITIC